MLDRIPKDFSLVVGKRAHEFLVIVFAVSPRNVIFDLQITLLFDKRSFNL